MSPLRAAVDEATMENSKKNRSLETDGLGPMGTPRTGACAIKRNTNERSTRAVDTVHGGNSPNLVPLFQDEVIDGLDEESEDPEDECAEVDRTKKHM